MSEPYSHWRRQTQGVYHILQNETHAEVWYYGKQGVAPDGKFTTNPVDHWVDTTVPAIISRETWEATLIRRAENLKKAKRNKKHNYLLSGHAQCKCGRSACGRPVTYRDTAYLYYQCAAYQTTGATCTYGAQNFRADHVDALVWHWLKDWFKDPNEGWTSQDSPRLHRGLEGKKAG